MQIPLPEAQDTIDFGTRLGGLLRAGDLVILTGDLGAGKTTLTKGIATGMGIEGPVSSPTFIIARVHPGPLPLVHVDAYRLTDMAEVDDLDLDSHLEESVTVVEWGEGLVEGLSQSRLEITLVRPRGDAEIGRYAEVRGRGARWEDVDLESVLSPSNQLLRSPLD